jgi:hypothetical protein
MAVASWPTLLGVALAVAWISSSVANASSSSEQVLEHSCSCTVGIYAQFVLIFLCAGIWIEIEKLAVGLAIRFSDAL